MRECWLGRCGMQWKRAHDVEERVMAEVRRSGLQHHTAAAPTHSRVLRCVLQATGYCAAAALHHPLSARHGSAHLSPSPDTLLGVRCSMTYRGLRVRMSKEATNPLNVLITSDTGAPYVSAGWSKSVCVCVCVFKFKSGQNTCR